MAKKTNKARTGREAGQTEGNVGLVQQLLSDARAGCYQGCAVRITSRSEKGGNYEVVGPVDRIDFEELSLCLYTENVTAR